MYSKTTEIELNLKPVINKD